jgi:hypothetical protein
VVEWLRPEGAGELSPVSTLRTHPPEARALNGHQIERPNKAEVG